MKPITVLSLFDGCGGAFQALKNLNIPIGMYLASETDRYAMKIAKKNHPRIINLGNVTKVTSRSFIGKIDLLIGGPPCQDLSIATKDRKGLSGDRSGLFWEYVRILKEVKPEFFLMENVASMSRENRQVITDALGVEEPIMINSALVTAQQRKRLYWTNIPGVGQPEDRHMYLRNVVLDASPEKAYKIIERSPCKVRNVNKPIRVGSIGREAQANRVYSIDGKSVCLSANGGGAGAKTGLYETLEGYAQKLTPIECERLQGLPDNYTEGVSDTQRSKMIGNGFTVPVIEGFLRVMRGIYSSKNKFTAKTTT